MTLNQQINALYDAVGDLYAKSKYLPFRKVEIFSYLSILQQQQKPLGNVLDLACGDGFFTRLLISEQLGADHAIGVDLSQRMIDLARQSTKSDNDNNIEYYCADASLLDSDYEFLELVQKKCGAAAKFDVVTAAYLLNYAKNVGDLQRFVKVILSFLKEGGKFVSVNDNVLKDARQYPPEAILALRRFGIVKRIVPKPATTGSEPLVEGDEIEYTFLNDNDEKSECRIVNYFMPAEVIERAFMDAGFRKFRWVDVSLPSELQDDPDWLLFQRFSPIICLEASL